LVAAGFGATIAARPPLAAMGWDGAATAGAAPPSTMPPPTTVPGPVRLDSNENPYRPSPRAFAAMRDAFDRSCRYPDAEVEELVAELAAHHGLAPDNVLLGEGSSEVLRIAVSACAGRRIVVADPTFEEVAVYSRSVGAEVTRVPLTADFRHDLPAMARAADGAGFVYVCNPNNPTASVTPAAEVRAFLAALPASVVAVVDEAYHHFAAAPYESVVPLVATLPNLLVVRTFSKIYGMAGLRSGYGLAQPALLARLRQHQQWDSLNVMALVAARAGLADVGYVETSRKQILAARAACCDGLAARGFRVIPSHANFFMVELGSDVRPVIAALRDRDVRVGRFFPSLPTHLRVTVGRPEEMEAFLSAFAAVLPRAA
jgi:histidinol-phosphate aminotransferase